VNEAKPRSREIAELRVELLGGNGETIAVIGLNSVVAKDAQRRPPEREVFEMRSELPLM
jgi:hypothetical protein